MKRVMAAVAVLALARTVSANDDEWTTYQCDRFGFSMLAPEGTDWEEKEWDGGWGGLYAHFEGVELFGLARLGVYATPEEIEKFGIEVTGIPRSAWKDLDSGKNKDGWRWYRVAACGKGDDVAFAGYGTGPSGSYMLVLKTTVSCLEKSRAQYEKWYRSVKVCACHIRGKGWTVYEDEKYAFSMLAPEGTKFKEREFEGGWGVLEAEYEGVKLLGIAKLGTNYTPEEIARFGVKLTGISGDYWKDLDVGENKLGWKWYHVVMAQHEDIVLFGGYGVGSKAGYLLFLKTTGEDYDKHEADYMKWYRSVVVR